jgi:phage head maturation protease
MVERGDIFESSFKYSTRKGDDRFERDENGDLIHIVERVSGLYDVSLVVDGAFANTNMAVVKRSLKEFEAKEQAENERKEAIRKELVKQREYLMKLRDYEA